MTEPGTHLLSKSDIVFIKESITPREAPILSIYFDANPAEATNQNRGWLIRVKDSLKRPEIPREVAEKVIHELEISRPAAHTCAVFASDDLLKIYSLQVDLPIVDTAHGQVETYWGEPNVFPLLYAIDEYARHGVVWMDKSKWHFYEVYLGEIREVADAFLDLPSDHSRMNERRPAQRFEHGVVLRGGAGGDRYERHIETFVQRFYKRAAAVLAKSVAAWDIDALIFTGPNEDTHFFENCLPRSLRQRVLGHTASLPKPASSAPEVLQKVAPVIEERLLENEMKLLDEIRDIGKWSVSTVLQALHMGRIHLLVAPWKLKGDLLRCAGGLVVENQEAAEAFCPGQSVQPVELRDVLPDLATGCGARLEFVHGEAELRLLREFGGLAGLSRW